MSVVSILSDQEALERFKESQSDLRSVAQIARLTEEQFVQNYADRAFFAGDIRLARRVYWTAVNVNARNALIWANIKDAVASPFYRATLFNNIPQEFIRHLENLPGYQRLFGNLDFVECDHCRSVFGPAAYFVDLVRFVEDFVSSKLNDRDQAFLIDHPDPARRRRPDLFSFSLDCANTHDLIPYIDLVNEVLEAVIRSPEQPDAYRMLDAASFPWSTPFSRPLAEIREYLGQLGANLSAIYTAYLRRELTNEEAAQIAASVDPAAAPAALAAAQAAKNGAAARNIDREYLQLSPAEYALVAAEATQPEVIEALYGTAYELTASSLQAIQTAAAGTLSDEAVTELGTLAGRPTADRSEFVDRLRKLAGGLRKASKVGLAGEIEANLDAIVAGAFNRYDLQRLAELPVFLEQTGLDRTEVNELIYQDLDRNEFNAGLSRQFFINDIADGLGALMVVDGPSGPGGFDERLVNLSYAKLDRIHRFVRLARTLGWSFTDLDMALRSLSEHAGSASASESVLQLDGIDDYVACRNVTGLDLADFTVEAWVNPSRHGVNVIVAKGRESDWQIHFLWLIDPDGKLAFYDQASKQFLTGASQIPTGVFSHVAVTVAQQTLQFYIDGKVDGVAQTLGQAIMPAGADLDIGRNLNDSFFAGMIADVRIWQGAASQEDIAAGRYRRLTGREPGLAGYWPLTENPYDQLFDLTANRNDGVMGGSEFVTQPLWVRRDLALEPAPEAVSPAGYRFNGVDQYLAARHVHGSDLRALTLETWVKWERRPTADDQEIIAKGQENTGQAQFRLWIDGTGHLVFKSTSLNEYRSSQTLTAGRWSHVAVTVPDSALAGPTFRWFASLQAVADFKAGALGRFASARQDDVVAAIQAELAKKPQRSGIAGVSAADFLDALGLAIGSAVLTTPTSPAAETPAVFIEQTLNSGGNVALSQDDMDALVSPRVPADVYSWLEQLRSDRQGQDFPGYDAFLDELRRTIGNDLLAPQRAAILEAAEVRCVRITIDGQPQQFELGQGSVVLAETGDTISVGRKLMGRPSYRYFQGWLKELRVWNQVRTARQLALGSVRTVGTREPGLVGYWRLDEVKDGQARDLSALGNHLFLGGILADYAPKRVATDYFLPPLPVAVTGKALAFDGQNNLVEIQNPQNRNLGAYDRTTLAFWFNAADAAAADREQILYTQGDAEDGLVIYLHNGILTAAAWANTFEGDKLETVVLKTAAGQIGSNKWHHIAVVKDEEAAPDAANTVPQKLVRYTALLDGAPFGQGSATFRLSPVGPSYLAGLGKDAVTWTEALGTHSSTLAGQTAGNFPHFFAGMLADLRVWRTARTEAELAIERFVAPVALDPGLILYLLLTETTGARLEDRSGNGSVATYLARNMVLTTGAIPAEMDEVHAHYAGAAALQWTNYAYTGRLRVGAAGSSIGLTFLSRYPDRVDRYYAIKCDKSRPAFTLSSHPEAVQTLQGTLDSQIAPQANVWHRFYIEVTAEADRTTVRARIWPETAPEPAAFQIDAVDASSVRISAGTVGLWTSGDGLASFDQIEVRPLAGGPPLLAETFERLADGTPPVDWQQTGTRGYHRGNNDLFRTVSIDGNTAYGTSLTEDGNVSLVSKRSARRWTNYTFRGDIMVTEDDGGVGVLFLAQDQNRYYRLGRSKGSPSFSVTAAPGGLQTLAGAADTGVVPAANTWYSFKIKTETGASATRIQAKVWRTEDAEPVAYQVDVKDTSDVRLSAGTIGVWSGGPGIKCADSLLVSTIEPQAGKRVYTALHSESFRSFRSGRRPAGWQNYGAVDRFQPLAAVFRASEAETSVPQWQDVTDYPVLLRPLNRKALAFDGALTYAAAEQVTGLHATQFTIEAWIRPVRAQAGPILSQQAQPGQATSLQLGLNAQGQLALSYARQDGTLETIAGATVLSTSDTSHVAATVDGMAVQLYLNGQQDGAATATEPVVLAGSSLELGRGVDLAAGAPATQVFDGQIRDLRIWQGARTGQQLADGRFQQPQLTPDLIGYWPFDEDAGDATADQSPDNDNALRLGGIERARRPELDDPSPAFALPALADPSQDAGLFDPAALKLDGQDDYVDIALAPAVTADAATWEAWVRPASFGAETTLWEQKDGKIRLAWQGNRLAAAIAGNDPQTQTFDHGFDPDAWAHVALVYDSAARSLNLFVNGETAGQRTYNSTTALSLSEARVGLNQAGQAGLRGLLKELRLWSVARTPTDIQATMFRRLNGAEQNLVVYRPFNEQASLEHAPAWVSPDLLADSLGQGFFRPQRLAVGFDGQSDNGLLQWTGAASAPAAPCQRRTVEVWFKADDTRISRRKQVIFHEGDHRQGLVLYLFDGRLYYGGYSLLADDKSWAHWTGTWLSTERVRSGKWHHAAIVLDGRDELRDGSFQAFLDGKLVDDGVGAQLARCSGSIALGRAGGTILFHDGSTVSAPAAAPVQPAAPKPALAPSPLTPAVLDKTSISLNKPQPSFPFPSQAFTVECWINPSVSRYAGSPISYAVSKDNDNTFVLYLYHHSALTVVINEQRISASGVVDLDAQRWQHVAVTWQASDGQIVVYKDGKQVYRGKISAGQPVASNGTLVFGQEQDRPGGEFDPNEAFLGKLNEVRIWDHVRTTDQVRDGMNQSLPGKEPGLIARWPADPAAGAPAGGNASPGAGQAGGAGGTGGQTAGAGQSTGQVGQPVDAALFAGQILDLRIWTTARSQRQLEVYRYRQLRKGDAAAGLDLWWQFEEVADGQVPDLSGNGHTGTLTPPASVAPIGAAPGRSPARSNLDADVLGRLANLKRLMERYRLPMDRLTALWQEIRHTGKEDGRTLWDDTFNPKGNVFKPWPFHIDQPMRWDVSGATDQEVSRQIRSRLMGALRVSHDNLNQLVATISGEGETLIELDGEYLTNLYRLARLPAMLRLNVTEFQRLMALMGLSRVDSQDTLMRVSERSLWMQRTGIDVYELDFLSNDRESAIVAFPYNDATVRDLADSLQRQSSELLARANTFVSAEVGELQSAGLFKLLQSGGLQVLDANGAVRPDYEPPAQLDKLVYLAPAGDAGDAAKPELNLTQAAYSRLNQAQLDQLKTSGMIGDNGLVLDQKGQILLDAKGADFSDKRLLASFSSANSDTLSLIREALERALKIQSEIAGKLKQLRDSLANATLAGISDLVGATPDRTLAVLQHLGQQAVAGTGAGQFSGPELEARRQLAARTLLKHLFDIFYAIRDDQQPVPASLTARPGGYLYQLSKILYLAGQFGLTVDEIGALVEDPARFSVASILRPGLADLTNLYLFASLKTTFADTEGKLIALLSTDGGSTDAVVAAIHDLTGWEKRQIRSLMATFETELVYNRVAGLESLRAMFAIAESLHVDVDFFTRQIADTTNLGYDFYARQSANLLEVLRSHYDDAQWDKVWRPIHDRLALQARDALLGRAMLAISPDFAGRRSPDVLSEYLLLDLQTGSEVDTSRMVQAIASLQLFVQRCMMNLERGIDPASVPSRQWEWMKNYRVWEANRKVFLYPENYIEPELRDTKTPFFEELEQDLLQGDLNADLVEKAYTRYLDKFVAVANLKIVGSYFEGKNETGTLYLLGRTRTEPKVYYLREHVEGQRWTPWQKISISIDADFAAPVYAFNRLFIFWVEFAKITESRPVRATLPPDKDPMQDKQGYKLKIKTGGTEIREEENVDVFKATIKYTYLNLAKEWVQPQTFMELGRHLEKSEIVRPEWQRPYLQRSLETWFSTAQQQIVTQEQAVKVLQLAANQTKATELQVPVPDMDMNRMTWSFLANFSNNRTLDAKAETKPRAETLKLIHYDNKLRLTGPGGLDDDFTIRVSDNITRIPGAPDVGAAQNAFNAAITAQATLIGRTNPNPTQAELDAAQSAVDRTSQELLDAIAADKWQTSDLILSVQIGNNTVAQATVAYGRWQQIAVTMAYDARAKTYALNLLIDGQSAAPAVTVSTGVFSQGRDLTIGQETNAPSHFTAQLSEFRLWNQVRDSAVIGAESRQRKATNLAQGLFHIGLDRNENKADLNLGSSSPPLNLERVAAPVPPTERERILLLWGKDIRRSIRNTLQTDESFNLTLEVQPGTPASYDLDLALERLYVLETPEFSINDYATGQQSTLSRFRADVKTWIISAANRNYKLTDAEFQQFRAVMAMWSAFGNVRADANDPNEIRAFLKALGIRDADVRLGAADDAHTLLTNLPTFDASFADVNNQPGWYILDTGDEQFLVKLISQQPLKTATERLKFDYGAETNQGNPQPLKMHFEADDALAAFNAWSNFRVEFTRLSTFVVHDLIQELFAGGIDTLLTLKTQQRTEIDFVKTYKPGPSVIAPNYNRATGLVGTGIDFDGAYGMYYREIFFHIPFFIANQLNTNQNFADAQRWYHYIFNPTIVEPKNPDPAVNPNDRYWQFLPLRNLSLETLRQMLSNTDALDEYRQDPFDPHAIARLRINAYQKAIVMKYIDNLLDWGDSLFSQDTRESINEAAQLYVLAYNLLGARPQSKAVKDLREIGTLEDVLSSQQAPQTGLPDFIVELDRRLAVPALAGPAPVTPNNAIVTDFCVIENEQFMGYWDRVEDRLYKIRHSLNIEGTFRQLALFQPPINPMDLVRAMAGGRDLGSVLSDLNVPVPHYRYSYMWDRAKDIASAVSGLGSALLDALEKKDGEALAILQNTHEKQILDLTTSIMEKEVEVIDETIEALNISKESIQARWNRFNNLITGGLNAGETAWLALQGIALVVKGAAGVAKVVKEATSTMPSVTAGASGFGGSPVAYVKFGGDEAEGISGAVAEGLDAVATALEGGAEIAAKAAEFARRAAEWEFERTIAGHELKEIDRQLAIAGLQLEIATQQLAIHKKTLQQNQEIADFYRSKFGNQALYNWMVSRLSGLYFQAYKLAYDYAKSAEKALQFELPTTQSYISFGHWDSLKKGLLAGESLLLELDRMEKSHLNQDSRFQEIEKQISMQRSLPETLAALTSSGTADFQLGEALFNRDFPGHYARMIKTIGISIKTSSEVSPYDSLYATLIQLGNRTLLEPNIDAVRYMMGVDGAEQPDANVLRTNWRANQQVAISRIDDEEGDDGMFALDFFFDNRYFPFEGTGAVSAWRLEISKMPENFDRSSISDVIIHLRYTAKYDSGGFKQAVIGEMRKL